MWVCVLTFCAVSLFFFFSSFSSNYQQSTSLIIKCVHSFLSLSNNNLKNHSFSLSLCLQRSLRKAGRSRVNAGLFDPGWSNKVKGELTKRPAQSSSTVQPIISLVANWGMGVTTVSFIHSNHQINTGHDKGLWINVSSSQLIKMKQINVPSIARCEIAMAR